MENRILEFECVGLREGGDFPIEHTGRGADTSPEFVLNNLSPNAESLIITLEDLSHPVKNFTHWVIWNLPASDKIPAGIPHGKTIPALTNACQGLGYGIHRYAGPKPPKGKRHEYRFTIYALNSKLHLSPRSRKRKVLKAAQGHIIQTGHICGYFG